MLRQLQALPVYTVALDVETVITWITVDARHGDLKENVVCLSVTMQGFFGKINTDADPTFLCLHVFTGMTEEMRSDLCSNQV